MSEKTANEQIFHSLGNIELLSQKKLALFSSKETPEPIFQSALELFTALQQQKICLAGGWQSPLEKWLFSHFTPEQNANCIYYLARDVNQFPLSPIHRQLLDHEKLLFIAPPTSSARPSKHLVQKRDALIFSQCRHICFLYINPGGRLQHYLDALVTSNHLIYILDHPLNRPFLTSDFVPLNALNIEILTIAS